MEREAEIGVHCVSPASVETRLRLHDACCILRCALPDGLDQVDHRLPIAPNLIQHRNQSATHLCHCLAVTEIHAALQHCRQPGRQRAPHLQVPQRAAHLVPRIARRPTTAPGAATRKEIHDGRSEGEPIIALGKQVITARLFGQRLAFGRRDTKVRLPLMMRAVRKRATLDFGTDTVAVAAVARGRRGDFAVRADTKVHEHRCEPIAAHDDILGLDILVQHTSCMQMR